jgi:hypothetical protein
VFPKKQRRDRGIGLGLLWIVCHVFV